MVIVSPEGFSLFGGGGGESREGVGEPSDEACRADR